MSRIKRFSAGFIFLLFTAACIAAYVLYQAGYYDIVFLQRESPAIKNVTENNNQSDVVETIETDGYEDEYTSPVFSGENVSLVTSPSGIEGLETTSSAPQIEKPPPTYLELLGRIENANNYQNFGWEINTDMFDKYIHKVVKFTPEIKIPKIYNEQFFTYIDDVFNLERMYFEDTEEVIAPLPIVTVYMGYYLIDLNKNTTILNPQGKVIVSDLKNLSPEYYRDSWGQPVFNYNGTKYIITDEEIFKPADPNVADINLAPALFGDYTKDYGTQKNNLTLYYEYNVREIISNKTAFYAGIEEPNYVPRAGNYYGYKKPDDMIALPPIYAYAYNFSENGLAVVADEDRVISIIDTRGNVVISSFQRSIFLRELNRYANEGYFLPDTRSMENIGMFYFDHGLLRIRRVVKDETNPKILQDYNVLIQEDGTVYTLPTGYDLVYYSDGILVLKKGDYYGCLNYTGKWIAQPFYTYARPFKEGLAVLGVNDKKGMIDTKGNIVLPFIYDEITDVSSGVIAAFEQEHGWTFYNKIAREG